MRGSWYAVEYLRDPTESELPEHEGQVFVRYTDEQGDEWVATERLRPKPPTPPSAQWTSRLTVGDAVDFWYEKGWWTVKLASRTLSAYR